MGSLDGEGHVRGRRGCAACVPWTCRWAVRRLAHRARRGGRYPRHCPAGSYTCATGRPHKGAGPGSLSLPARLAPAAPPRDSTARPQHTPHSGAQTAPAAGQPPAEPSPPPPRQERTSECSPSQLSHARVGPGAAGAQGVFFGSPSAMLRTVMGRPSPWRRRRSASRTPVGFHTCADAGACVPSAEKETAAAHDPRRKPPRAPAPARPSSSASSSSLSRSMAPLLALSELPDRVRCDGELASAAMFVYT
jgi:hypothetical protein